MEVRGVAKQFRLETTPRLLPYDVTLSDGLRRIYQRRLAAVMTTLDASPAPGEPWRFRSPPASLPVVAAPASIGG